MKITIRRAWPQAFILSALLLLSGCAFKSTLEDISNINPSNEVIMVGRIEIEPKMEKEDVTTSMAFGSGDLYRTFILRVREDIGDTTDYTSDRENAAVVYTDGDFYLQQDRKEAFMIFGGWFYTQLSGGAAITRSTVFYRLKGGLKIEYPKTAKAVYVGTIKFKRDEFFNLKAVDILQNDLAGTQKRFQTKFRSKMQLEKAKITKATS